MTDDELARKKRRHRNERIAAAIFVLVAIGATAGIYLWSERTKAELRRDQSYIPKKAVVTPEVLLLQEYVRIDTSTPEGAANGARWLVAYLEKNGVHAELIASAPNRLNVYARIAGKNRGEGLMLFHHIDVVPPNGTWKNPPFEGKIVGDSMVGRGTLDMKGIGLCQLFAFVEIAKSGKAPDHDLVLLATADEETGSEFGMQWLLRNRPDVFADVQYGITEGGVTEILRERMTYYGIEVGGKQVVKVTVGGGDVNTLRRFRIALEPYMQPRLPERILPVVREYFRRAAPSRLAYRAQLEDVDRAVADGSFWILPTPYRDLTQNTIWASDTYFREGEWRLDIHLRNLPDEDPDARLGWLQKLADPMNVHIYKVWSKEGPAPISPTDTRLFTLIEGEAKRRYKAPVGPQLGYRSASDSRFLRPRGIVCYGVSPYPVNFGQSISIHGVDERIRLDHFLEGIELMKNVVRDWSWGD